MYGTTISERSDNGKDADQGIAEWPSVAPNRRTNAATTDGQKSAQLLGVYFGVKKPQANAGIIGVDRDPHKHGCHDHEKVFINAAIPGRVLSRACPDALRRVGCYDRQLAAAYTEQLHHDQPSNSG